MNPIEMSILVGVGSLVAAMTATVVPREAKADVTQSHALAKPVFPSDSGLTLERLKAHYAGLSRLQADVEQTRTGRHLLKPFVSQIRLDYAPGVITWNYVKPFVQTVRVSR